MTAKPDWYDAVFARYQEMLNRYDHLYLALSAGVDSNLLLHFLYTYKETLPPISTLHVNHNWHGDYSHLWADFARKRAQAYGFPHHHFELNFPAVENKTLEAEGREARYEMMANAMVDNSLLLTAHHRSDQAETLFHRLLRRSGLKGMGAMRDHTTLHFNRCEVEILRPLLSISKMTLYETARTYNIPWLEDYTNHDIDVTRNMIRNGIFPKVAEFFPDYEAAFYQTSLFLQEAQDLHDEIATIDFTRLNTDLNLPKESLCYSKLRELSRARIRNLIHFWLGKFGLSLNPDQFERFYQSYIETETTTQSRFIIGPYTLFYFDDALTLIDTKQLTYTPSLNWMPAPNMPSQTVWDSLNPELVKRPNGARFHPIYRDKSQTLKKLLQENNVPPWIRENLWVLRNQETHEIYWVQSLGIAKSLAPHITATGVTPTLKMD